MYGLGPLVYAVAKYSRHAGSVYRTKMACQSELRALLVLLWHSRGTLILKYGSTLMLKMLPHTPTHLSLCSDLCAGDGSIHMFGCGLTGLHMRFQPLPLSLYLLLHFPHLLCLQMHVQLVLKTHTQINKTWQMWKQTRINYTVLDQNINATSMNFAQSNHIVHKDMPFITTVYCCVCDSRVKLDTCCRWWSWKIWDWDGGQCIVHVYHE